MTDPPQGWFRAERPVTGPAGAPAGSGAPGQWPAQPPARRAPGRSRWWRPRTVFVILAVMVMLLLAAGAGLYSSVDGRLTRIDALVATTTVSAGQNWLITGSTGTLTRRQERQLHTGHDTDTLSDTIMLLHVPANGGRPVLVSIPRDSYVPIPGNGQNKINAAFAFGGAPLLIRTVQDVTGLRIDHYLGIGYTGLVSVVNAIGGVTMCLPGPMADPQAGLHLKAGCQVLDGKQALAYARTRAFAVGDLQRVQDQRILLKAILSKLTSAGTMANPFAVVPATMGAASALTVDRGTSLNQLIQVAFALRSPQTTTVPFGGFANTSVGSVVLWNRPAALRLFSDLAKDRPVPRDLLTGSIVKPTV
jgi:LCP family protein required for cell wall assembly